jgi:hypothetical protein
LGLENIQYQNNMFAGLIEGKKKELLNNCLNFVSKEVFSLWKNGSNSFAV